MPEPQTMLLKTNLKHLRLPTMSAEFAKLAREASAANEDYEQYLLRLTELEVAARSANAMKARIKQAGFPVIQDLDTYDFSLLPSLNKPKVLELARGEWIDQPHWGGRWGVTIQTWSGANGEQPVQPTSQSTPSSVAEAISARRAS